jgi:hypothetical protein
VVAVHTYPMAGVYCGRRPSDEHGPRHQILKVPFSRKQSLPIRQQIVRRCHEAIVTWPSLPANVVGEALPRGRTAIRLAIQPKTLTPRMPISFYETGS